MYRRVPNLLKRNLGLAPKRWPTKRNLTSFARNWHTGSLEFFLNAAQPLRVITEIPQLQCQIRRFGPKISAVSFIYASISRLLPAWRRWDAHRATHRFVKI